MPANQVAHALNSEVFSHWVSQALAQQAAYDAIAAFFA